MELLGRADHARAQLGLMTIAEILELTRSGNIILDPWSLLVARGVTIGSENVLGPAISLLCGHDARLVIGDRNELAAGTVIDATSGDITIGNSNQFGPGGCTVRTIRPGERIAIGDDGRYRHGCQIFGRSLLGSGSQVTGPIVAESCTLGSGGSFAEPDPDLRGAVLKGGGIARDIVLERGRVIQGCGPFRPEDVKPQSFFHPKPVQR